MRITFKDTDRPKAAAKLIVRVSGRIRLNEAQEAIAKATGHRDWHDLSGATAAPTSQVGDETAIACITVIAEALGVRTGDIQYALTRSRVLPGITLDRSLAIQARIWRGRLFGAGSRGRPGTVVRVRSPGEDQPGYLLRPGRPTYVMLDGGIGMRADFEVTTPRQALPDFVPNSLWLPYGFWTWPMGRSSHSRETTCRCGGPRATEPSGWTPGSGSTESGPKPTSRRRPVPSIGREAARGCWRSPISLTIASPRSRASSMRWVRCWTPRSRPSATRWRCFGVRLLRRRESWRS